MSKMTRKYFAALDLTEDQKEDLSLIGNRILLAFGDRLSKRNSSGTLHVTLGVIEDDDEKEVDLDELKEVLVGTLTSLGGIDTIHLSNLGRFDRGAVYMEVEDEDGNFARLRDVMRLWADRNGHTLLDQSIYHVTLFRANTLRDPFPFYDTPWEFRRQPHELNAYNPRHGLDLGEKMKIYVGEVRRRPAVASVAVAGSVQEESVQSIDGAQ